MVRPPSIDSNGMKKGAWSEDEDNKLRAYIQRYGHWNWRLLPKFAGLKRCGKSCRLRWVNYLKPGVKRGNFSKEEQDLVIKLHLQLGNKWSAIAEKLPGRTDNEIKNFWHTRVERRRRKQPPLHHHNQIKNPIILPKADDNLFEMTADSSSSEASSSSSSSSLSLPFHFNNLPSSPSTNPQDQLEVMLSQIPEADDANHHNHTTFAPLLTEVEGEFDYPELRYTGLSCSGSSYVDSSWPAADDDVCGSFWNESSSSSESDSSNYTYTYSYTNTTPVQEEGLLYNYDPLLVDYFDYEADLFC